MRNEGQTPISDDPIRSRDSVGWTRPGGGARGFQLSGVNMLWRGRRQSRNIEDRRAAGGGGGFRGRRGAGLGLGTIVIVLAVSYFLGADPATLLRLVEQGTPPAPAREDAQAPAAGAGPADELGQMVAVVLADTEDVWADLFRASGRAYEPATLVLFSDGVSSACGYNSAAVGPFYCPADRNVYIDLGFFDELDRRFGAPGDFAQAYVIAHEVGHHVQNLLGISADAHRLRSRAGRERANDISVRQELQADCFAGVWAHHAQARWQILEAGDVEEGLGAASAIGDDRLQREAGRRVQPESWTHGSSEMRVRWFRRGLDSGQPGACDTFSEEAP